MSLAPQTFRATPSRWRGQARFASVIGAALGTLVVAASEPGPPGRSSSPYLPSLPLWFEDHRGQTGSDVQFLARGHGHSVLLTPTEAVVVLRKTLPATEVRRGRARDAGRTVIETRSVRFRLVGAQPQARMDGLHLLPGQVNYFLGSNPVEWRSRLSTFKEVQVQQAYPGVDVIYHASGQQLEYDFHVAPRADPARILVQIDGADCVELDSAGNLVVEAGGERVHQHRPVAYQLAGDVRRPVDVSYRLLGERTFCFVLGDYDTGRPLVIDPVLSYSTYLGGSKAETAWDIALDSGGNVYVTGESLSPELPTTTGAFQTNYGGGTAVGGDVFVAKLEATGSNLVYLTYLGGKGDDAALSLAIDGGGNAYLTGFTYSTNFPLASAIITNLSGTAEPYFGLYPSDAFITKLDSTGSALVYSTYLGGRTNDQGIAIAVDSSGSAYVTGFTDSTDFPTVNALQTIYAGSNDVFVTKVSPDGSAFVYSTYLGGTNTDQGEGIAVDAAGRAVVTGFTQSTNFPTLNALQPWLAGGRDVFVSVLDAGGTNLIRSTYLGSRGNEIGHRVVLDSAANAYVTGSKDKDSFSFPVSPHGLNQGGVLRSDNGGATWSSANQGLLHNSISALAIDPVVSTRIYAGTGHGLARSTTGGGTWQTSIGAPRTTAGLAPAIGVGVVNAIAVDPAVPSTVYGGTASEGVFKSLDGGANWTSTSTGLVNLSINALVIDPLTPATIYAGTAAGVYRSTNAAANWRSYSSGLGSQNVRALAIDPATPDTLFAATPNGVYRSINRGTNWSGFNNGLTNLSVLSLAIHPTTPSTLYAGTASGLFKTINRATNWSGLQVAAGVSNINALAIDPQSPSTLLAATSAGLYRSTDAGGSWTLSSDVVATELAINPQTPATVFAGTAGSNSFGLSDAFVTKMTGTDVDYSVILGGLESDEAWDLALDPARNVYVVGATTSTNFPVVQPLPSQRYSPGGGDAFVTAIEAGGSALLYSTYLGGRSDDRGYGIEVDLAGAAYVVGQTTSTNFPMYNALQPLAGGLGDAFVAKLTVIPSPVLNIALTNTHVILSWPVVAFGYVLQSKTNLTTNTWATVTNPPVWSGEAYTVTLGATNQSRYFRLLSP